MEKWQERRILILGTTYPSHSKKYNETVCTGGIDEESGKMVRLHPVPIRYLEPQHQFKKFQWIRAMVTRHESDPRPESFRIQSKSIVLEDVVLDHEVRRGYLERSPHLIESLEALKEKQIADGTSLGIIMPRDILDCSLVRKPESERADWMSYEKARMAQDKLFGDPVKPLDFPEVEFTVNWACRNDDCPTHSMHLLQWGIHELYRKLRSDPDCESKLIARMYDQLDEGSRDVFLFLGNFRAIMYNFGLMDSYSPPKRKDSDQLILFTK